MLRPRWRKVLRDLWGNKARSILVVISIAVGVFAVGTTMTAQTIINENLNGTWNSLNPPHVTLYTTSFDPELVETVRKVPGVGQAEGRRVFTVRVKQGDEWRSIEVKAIADYANVEISKMVPQRGTWPPPQNEIVLERQTLIWLGVKIGDSLAMETPTGKGLSMRIAGTMFNMNMPPVNLFQVGSGAVSMDSLGGMGEPRQLNQIYVNAAENAGSEEHRRDVGKVVTAELQKLGVSTQVLNVGEPGKHPVGSMISALLMVLTVLGTVTLVLSVFLVVNVISAVLTQQIRQIGIMKAVGARFSQIMGLYLGMIAVYGLLALVVAIPLGALGAQVFVGFVGNLLNLETSFTLPPSVLIIEVAVGLLIPMLAGAPPIIATARIVTRAALAGGPSEDRVGRSLLDRFVRLIPVSRPLQLSLRNTFRRKARLCLTLITLVLSGMVFMGVVSTSVSTQVTMDNALAYYAYDFHAGLAEPLETNRAVAEALKVPGVIAAEGWGFSQSFRVINGKLARTPVVAVTPPPATTMIKPTVKEGRWLKNGDGNHAVVNTDFLIEYPDVKIGSDITLNIRGRDVLLHVVGVVTGQLSGGVVFADPAYVHELTGLTGKTNFLVAKTDKHDGKYQRTTGEAMQDAFRKAGLRVGATETTTQMREGALQRFGILIKLLLIMASLLAVVGALGLGGTMGINVLERTREIGVMRAIGAANGAVLRIFWIEGVIIGLIGWLIGAALAFPFGKFLSDFIGRQFSGAPLDFVYSWSGVAIWLGISLALATAAAYFPARKASRLTVREILAYE